MKSTLQHMFRNDADALELIDTYLNLVAAYTPEEINRLKSDPYALQIDFESYCERVDYEAAHAGIQWPVEVSSGWFRG